VNIFQGKGPMETYWLLGKEGHQTRAQVTPTDGSNSDELPDYFKILETAENLSL